MSSEETVVTQQLGAGCVVNNVIIHREIYSICRLILRTLSRSLLCSYVLPEACTSPRMVCVAFWRLHALCIRLLIPALAAFCVLVDVTHYLEIVGDISYII